MAQLRASLLAPLAALVVASLVAAHRYKSPLSYIRHDRLVVREDPSIELGAVPDVLSGSWSWCLVMLKVVRQPQPDDWIGVFTVNRDETTINATRHAPVKFKYANSSDYTYENGVYQFNFYLINMRQDYMFGYFQGGLGSPIQVAVSNRVKVANPNQPTQGHLSLTHDPTEMMLQWVTHNVSDATVQWGMQSKDYTEFKSKKANSSTYKVTDMCGSPANSTGWMEPGTLHSVAMDGLRPSTRYYYRFGSDTYGWSQVFSFKSAPLAGPDSSVRIIAFGDLGHGEVDGSNQVRRYEQPSLNTTKNMIQEINETDLIVHIGDLSYAVGYAAQWDEYFSQIEPLAASVPYMVCPGNHETDWPDKSYYMGHDSGGECNIPYILRNLMPRDSPNTPWYGFDFGPVHFVMMSTEDNFTLTSEQNNYLIKHLAAVNRTRTPWLIFTGHRPMYVDSTDNSTYESMQEVAQLMQESLEDTLKNNSVDIAFWGHHHSYQRTCKMYKSNCTSDGIIHIVIGMAGRKLLQDFEETEPDYWEKLDATHYGFTRLMINSTTLVFQYVQNDDQQVHDQIVLKK